MPPHIDVAAVEDFLKSRLSVADLHDLHIGGTSTTQSALTVHLVMPDGYPGDVALDRITRTLTDRFSIPDSTLPVEKGARRTTFAVCLQATAVAHAHTTLGAAAPSHRVRRPGAPVVGRARSDECLEPKTAIWKPHLVSELLLWAEAVWKLFCTVKVIPTCIT